MANVAVGDTKFKSGGGKRDEVVAASARRIGNTRRMRMLMLIQVM